MTMLRLAVIRAEQASYLKFSSLQPRLQHRYSSSNQPVEQQRPRFVDRNYGEKVVSIFSKNEMERRLSNLRSHMTNENIGAVVMTSMHNIKYFSDYLYCSFGRPYGLVVTHDKCVLLAGLADGMEPWRRSFCDVLTYTDWQRDNFVQGVHSQLKGLESDKIGLEWDHMTLKMNDTLKTAWPKAQMVDVGDATMKMRVVKSEEEQNIQREGVRISELGGKAVIEALQEGVEEWEITEHANRTMVKEIAKSFPQTELKDIFSWFQSGVNTNGCHNYPTSRRIQRGEACSMNLFPMISGYYSALERTVFLGHASDAQIHYWEINCEVHKKGLELVKPGVRCCDITEELNDIYIKHGLLKNRTIGHGHSMGLMCHYYGREGALELREDCETVLEPGMILSMEPMLYIPEGQPGEGGYREHDILIITEDGADNITNFPIGPEQMIISK